VKEGRSLRKKGEGRVKTEAAEEEGDACRGVRAKSTIQLYCWV